MNIEQLITDLNIVFEAVDNNDNTDAKKLLVDIMEDLRVALLLGQ